jgi:hypothetical protein
LTMQIEPLQFMGKKNTVVFLALFLYK